MYRLRGNDRSIPVHIFFEGELFTPEEFLAKAKAIQKQDDLNSELVRVSEAVERKTKKQAALALDTAQKAALGSSKLPGAQEAYASASQEALGVNRDWINRPEKSYQDLATKTSQLFTEKLEKAYNLEGLDTQKTLLTHLLTTVPEAIWRSTKVETDTLHSLWDAYVKTITDPVTKELLKKLRPAVDTKITKSQQSSLKAPASFNTAITEALKSEQKEIKKKIEQRESAKALQTKLKDELSKPMPTTGSIDLEMLTHDRGTLVSLQTRAKAAT